MSLQLVIVPQTSPYPHTNTVKKMGCLLFPKDASIPSPFLTESLFIVRCLRGGTKVWRQSLIGWPSRWVWSSHTRGAQELELLPKLRLNGAQVWVLWTRWCESSPRFLRYPPQDLVPPKVSGDSLNYCLLSMDFEIRTT